MRRLSRLLSNVMLCGLLVPGGLHALHWYAAPAFADSKAACANADSLRCKICQLLDRADCTAEPEVGCPATTLEYSNRFPQFEVKLSERRTLVASWTNLRKEMEAIQNKGSTELCKKHIEKMTNTEKEIGSKVPTIDRCPGESAITGLGQSGGPEVSTLMRYRDCSEAKAKEIGQKMKERAKSGGGSGQLLSFKDEITTINAKSIVLLQEFREQTKEATQVRCWLRERIRDCEN